VLSPGFPGKGCVIAALGSDIVRQPKRVRDAFTGGLKDSLAFLAGFVPAPDASHRSEHAIVARSCMARALILARAVNDEALSRRILETAAKPLNRSRKRRSAFRRS
jgi:TetR/AcrR family transcriptional regulator, transcriptional repressor for nem operon